MTTKQPRPGATPTLRISGPGELLQAVPYLLGFHPCSSLVLVGMRRSGNTKELVVTARLDLVDAVEVALLADTVHTLRGAGSDEILAVIYDDVDGIEAGCLPWSGLAALVAEQVERAAAVATEVVLVARGRWWSYSCAGTDCCPPDGQPVPGTPSAFAAAATYAGVVALPDRESLEQSLAPVPARRAAVGPLLAAAEQDAVAAVLAGDVDGHARSMVRAVFTAAAAAQLPRAAPVDDDLAADLLVALARITVRDAVWMAVDHGRLDGRALWRELARCAPDHYVAAPLFLFGWASWRSGNGALAAIAVHRAVDCDPTYSAADMLGAMLSHGIDPRRFPRLQLPRSARAGGLRPPARRRDR